MMTRSWWAPVEVFVAALIARLGWAAGEWILRHIHG